MKVENGRKTETISIQRLLHSAKVPLSLSFSSLYVSGEEESRSNIFVCRILRSSTVERKTSNCRLLTFVLSLSALDGKLRGSSRFSRTENGERREVANEPFVRGLDDRLRMPRSPAVDTTKRREKRRHAVTEAHSPRNSDV